MRTRWWKYELWPWLELEEFLRVLLENGQYDNWAVCPGVWL